MKNELQNVDVIVTNGSINFQNFEAIKTQVQEAIKPYANVILNEDDIKDAKKIRASLNLLKTDLKAEYIRTKEEFEKPLLLLKEQFDELIDTVGTGSDNVGDQIKASEELRRNARIEEMKSFYDEQIKATDIDFLTYESVGLNVTLSASTKSLKEAITTFIAGIQSDLELIETQTHKERILACYHKTLDVKSSISTVLAEIEREELVKKQREEREARLKEEQERALQAQPVLEVTEEPIIIAAPKEVEPVLNTTFTVYGTVTQLKALKAYMESEGLRYE